MPRPFSFSLTLALVLALGAISLLLGDDGSLRTIFLEIRMYFQRHALMVYALCFAAFFLTLLPDRGTR